MKFFNKICNIVFEYNVNDSVIERCACCKDLESFMIQNLHLPLKSIWLVLSKSRECLGLSYAIWKICPTHVSLKQCKRAVIWHSFDNQTIYICNIVKSFIDCPHLLAQIIYFVPPRLNRSSHVFHLPSGLTNFLLKYPILIEVYSSTTECLATLIFIKLLLPS